MLINWLPLLLVEQGFQPSQAAGVMFALQMRVSGTLMLGALMDKLRPVTMSLLIYSGMLASLLALGTVSSFNGMLLVDLSRGCLRQVGKAFCMPWHRCFTVRRSAQQVWEQPWRRASGGYERSVTGRENAGIRHWHGRRNGRFCTGYSCCWVGGVYYEPEITNTAVPMPDVPY